MTTPDPKKNIRKRSWIRYERNHSLSAVHMDWHLSKSNGSLVCVVLDDASRMILSSGEFEAATAENSIRILKEAHLKYHHISPIREVITDHGTQFCANKRDSDGNASIHLKISVRNRELNISLRGTIILKAMVKLNDGFRYISKKEKIMKPLMILSNGIMRLDHTKALTGQ